MSETIVFEQREAIQAHLQELSNEKKNIGFVPTMGALHEGHLALVQRAQQECEVVVVSIFVNPTQFNNKTDLEKYPRMIDADVQLLSSLGKILVFVPSEQEVYPQNDNFSGVDLGNLDKVLEGEFRPGHFAGVTHVVHNLFEIVKPQKAFFGKKDYQQLAVINEMVRQLKLPVEIIGCETLRESSGLARSSRNMRLSTEEKEFSLIIVNTLRFIQQNAEQITPSELAKKAKIFFGDGKIKLEYLEIIDGKSFAPLRNEWSNNAVCCIAAHCGSVRLIDNVEVFGVEI